MNLGDLKTEFYEVIGDDAAEQRLIQEADVKAWMNDSTQLVRGIAGDIWVRETVPTVAGQGRYTLPAQAHRAVRLAYGWETLYEVSHSELDAMDLGWQTRTGRPEYFTQDTELHNQFVLYRIPEANSVEFTEVVAGLGNTHGADFGIVGRFVRGGVDVIFNADLGEVGSTSFMPVAPDTGIISGVDQVPDDQIVIWYVGKASPMLDDSSIVPIRRPFSRLPLWFALWKYYGSEAEFHNGILSALYRDWFYREVSKLLKLVARPLPRQRHVMGSQPQRARRYQRHPYADTMVPPSGTPVRLIW